MKIEIIVHEAQEILPGNTEPLGKCTVGCKIEHNGKVYGDLVTIKKEKLTLQEIAESGGDALAKTIAFIIEHGNDPEPEYVCPEGHKVIGKSKLGFPIIKKI